MKKNIHPVYYNNSQVTCACGNIFTTGSTKSSITVEVCYKCHPFYTGEQRFLDTKGRVDTFLKKQEVAKQYQSLTKPKKSKKEDKEQKRPKTLRELLTEI